MGGCSLAKCGSDPYGAPMSMDYAPVPRGSSIEAAQVRRSVRALHSTVARVERLLADRSFRLVAVVALNVLDLLTTFVVLALGGSESNPAMAPHIDVWWKPVLIKVLVLALLLVAVLRAPLHSRLVTFGLASVWIFYAGVVVWNTLLLIRY